MSCIKGTGTPSEPQSPPAAPAAPRETHPFHLFRPKTRVKTDGNKHEAIWVNRPFYGIVYRSLRQPGYQFWLEVFAAQIGIVLVGWLLFARRGPRGPRGHARRYPRGRNVARGVGTDRPTRVRRRAPGHKRD